MTLHCLRAMSPDEPALLAVMLSGRRPRPRHWGHHWLRIADRLAGGVPPAVAALPEGGDAALVGDLLALEDFRELVAAAEEERAVPAEAYRRELVFMARQALERALACDDVGAALFVLEEDARGRDPCATLVDSVLRCRSRALASAAMPAPPEPEPEPAPEPPAPPAANHAHDPLRRLMHRGTARLRDDVEVEEALRLIAGRTAPAAPEAPAAGMEATRAAAERALALRRAATQPPMPMIPAPVMHHDGLHLRCRGCEPVEPAPVALASQPRRAQAP